MIFCDPSLNDTHPNKVHLNIHTPTWTAAGKYQISSPDSQISGPPHTLLWRDPRLQQSTFFLTGTPDVKDRWEMERGQEAGEKRHWGRSLAGFYTEAKAHEIKDDHPAVRNRALLAYFGPLWVPIETCYKAYASCQSEQPRALWDHWWNMDNGVQGGHKGRQAT